MATLVQCFWSEYAAFMWALVTVASSGSMKINWQHERGFYLRSSNGCFGEKHGVNVTVWSQIDLPSLLDTRMIPYKQHGDMICFYHKKLKFGEILPTKRLCGLEKVTWASINIRVRSEWVKLKFWVKYSLNTSLTTASSNIHTLTVCTWQPANLHPFIWLMKNNV